MVYKVLSKDDLEAKCGEAGDQLVVIDFFATWCGPCKRIAPLLDDLAKKHAGKAVFLKVDVDEVEELVGEYSIEVMPTFVFKRKGAELDKLVGSNEQKLQEKIESLVSA